MVLIKNCLRIQSSAASPVTITPHYNLQSDLTIMSQKLNVKIIEIGAPFPSVYAVYMGINTCVHGC